MTTKRWGPFLFCAAIAAALLPEVVFQGKVLVGDNDRLVQEIPFLQLAAQTLQHHALPFWNSYSFCGHPGIGQANLRIFYPLTFIVAALFPSHVMLASSWRIVLEIFITLVCYYLFFRKVWKDELLALFSALACSICTFMVVIWYEGHVLFYFPALILYVLWDWEERSLWLSIAGLAAGLSLLLLGAFFQTAAYFLPLLFCLSAARSLSKNGFNGASLGRFCALWAGASALAVLIVSPDLAPFLEDFARSNRTGISFASTYSSWAPPWYMVFRVLLPYFPGDQATWNSNAPLIEHNSQLNHSEAFPAYAGVATFLFCLVAARRFRRRDTLPWVLAIGALTVSSLRTPFIVAPYLLYLKAPLLHGRLATAIPLCMAFLAPVGMILFLEGDARFKRSCFFQTAAVVGWVVVLAGGFLGERVSLYRLFGASGWGGAGASEILGRFRLAAWELLAFGGVLVLLMGACAYGRISARWFKLAMVGLLACDLVYFARTHSILKDFREESGWYPASPLTTFLDQLPDRDQYHFAITPETPWASMPGTSGFQPNVNIPYRLHIVDGYANLIDDRYAGLASEGAGVFRGFRSNVVTSDRLADVLAVKYIVVPNRPDSLQPYAGYADTIFSTPEAAVLQKRGAISRFHLACRTIPMADSLDAALRAIHDPAVDLRRDVILPAGEGPSLDNANCQSIEQGRLRMDERWSGRIEGHASLLSPAFLVITETFKPGWRAWVNGAPAKIIRANYAFQAVELPAGDSIIELRYAPEAWEAFRAASAIGLVILLACLVAGAIRSRQRWANSLGLSA